MKPYVITIGRQLGSGGRRGAAEDAPVTVELGTFYDDTMSAEDVQRVLKSNDSIEQPAKCRPVSPTAGFTSTAIFPLDGMNPGKYLTPVNRIDNAYGDRHLICTCPSPIDWEPPKA